MLHELARYARDHELDSESGFKPKTATASLVFSAAGSYVNVFPHDRKNPYPYTKCPDFSQPEIKRIGNGCRHFLIDQADVVALHSKTPDDPKLIEKHTFFVDLLQRASDDLPELSPIADVLSDDDTLAAIRAHMEEHGIKPADKVSFIIDDKHFLESDRWHDRWRRLRVELLGVEEAGDTDDFMRCFMSGELVKPEPTHPKITGLASVGGQPSGDVLMSFKQDSFCSYGLSQSANACVSREQAGVYATALSHLLRSDRNNRRLGDVKIAFWYSGEVPPRDDPVFIVEGFEGFDGYEDDEIDEAEEIQALRDAGKLIESIKKGKHPETLGYRYYAVTLSGAAGRVMIRDWMEGTFKDLVRNVEHWYRRITIVSRDGSAETVPLPKFMAVVGATVRDLKDVPAPTITRLWRCAVAGDRIPYQVMTQALQRIRMAILDDKPIRHAAMGLIRAYHIDHTFKGDKEKIMTQGLNEDMPAPAYQCGRLMAVLADLQYDALGDVGAGIVQRYYAAACATPKLIFGRLLRLAQFHGTKASAKWKGAKRFHDKQIESITNRISPAEMPTILDLEGQSLFALGFYHQQAEIRRRKAEAKAAKNDKNGEE